MASNLFNIASEIFAKQLANSFGVKELGRLANRAETLARRGLLKGDEAKQLSRRLVRISGAGIARDVLAALEKSGLGNLEGRSTAERKSLMGRLTTTGAVGKLFGKLLSPDRITGAAVGIEDEINAAANLLIARGYGDVTPNEIVKRKSPMRGVEPNPESERGKSLWKIQDGPGIWTGEMIDVKSSNVHSIGFRADPRSGDPPRSGTLLIRFLGKDAGGKRSGPGALYEYHEVPADLFRKFKWAASKGKFVWDNVRVRGTVSGHKFAYDLAGISQGYVPRQAGLRRGHQGEWFMPRKFAGHVSVLPMQQVRSSSRRTDRGR